MTQRLDLQRLPSRLHRRLNTRKYRRGYGTLPHAVWGDSFGPVGTAGALSLTSISPATFAAVGSTAVVFTLVGTGFATGTTINFCGTVFGAGNLTINSPTSATFTSPAPSGFAGKVGVQPVWMINAAGPSNTRNVVVTATMSDPVDAPLLPGDPGAYVISIIESWVDQNPDLADEVLAAEQARETPRVTLVDWLQGFISHRDDGTLP